MEWQQSPYTIPLILTTFITLASVIYIFRQRHIPGAYNLLGMLLAVSWWILFYVLELRAVFLDDKILWAKAQYLGIVYIPVGYTLFVVKYIGELHRIKRPGRFSFGLLIIPMITLILTWSNEWHHLIWVTTGLKFSRGLSYLTVTHGLWFWINIGFVYILLLGSSFLLMRKIVASHQLYRGQMVLMILGSLCPWLGNALYITGSNPFPNLDPTPFAFAVTAVFFAWSLYRYSFLDIVPVARSLVIEKLNEGVIVVDMRNRVVDINETAVSLLNQDNPIVFGEPLALNRSAWRPLQNILQTDEPAKTEVTIDETHYELSVTFLAHANGEPNGRLITIHNITARKKAELLLQHAKEAAEAADRAKTNFLTNMSHEIRTPLNAVVGMTEMLRQTSLNANQHEMLDIVAQSSNDLVLLINNILDFAKLEAGDLKLNNQSFDLIDCVEAALQSVRQSANDKQLQLTYSVDDHTPTMLAGDPVRLRQILVNLVENGIKFTEAGDVSIAIHHTEENEDIVLHFVVKDSGIGIDSDQIESLFSPFKQVDGSVTRAHGGNGVGLVICQRLVALMGGEIYIQSEIGRGTAVHFSAHFSSANLNHVPAVTLRRHETSLSNKRLLVITAKAANRRQISKEARMAGMDVYVAGNAQEASYWIANSQPFDVAMLDTAVWQKNAGIMGQLRHSQTQELLPIILLSADSNDMPHEAEGLFSGYLHMPIVGAQLYDVLMNIFAVSTRSNVSLQESNELMGQRYPLNILLVEDNKLNQRILQNMLAKLGYEANVAPNGKVGVDAAAKTNYDVILMDIQMPIMDGMEATKQILANHQAGKRPYIIAVTAHALKGDREHYLSSGMNAYMSKPVKLNQLVEALYQSINLKSSPAPAPIDNPATLAAPESSTNAPIDLEELTHLVGNDTEGFLEMMAPIFLEDAADLLINLAKAIHNNNCTDVAHAAHTLKGSSASMAMTQLAIHSRQLETAAKAQDLANAPLILEQIQAEYHRVEMVLLPMVKTAV